MVSLFHLCAHTGHSTSINIGYYLDSLNPFNGLPGAHVLHGNKQIHMKVFFPDIGIIGQMNQAAVEHLIHFIFGAPTTKELQKGQSLWCLLQTFSAAVILHQRHVLKDCGSNNQVFSVIIECAENANIVDVNHTIVPHFELFIFWSKQLEYNWGQTLKLTELESKGGVEGYLEPYMLTHIAKTLKKVK